VHSERPIIAAKRVDLDEHVEVRLGAVPAKAAA
jgi:hypothetical protein